MSKKTIFDMGRNIDFGDVFHPIIPVHEDLSFHEYKVRADREISEVFMSPTRFPRPPIVLRGADGTQAVAVNVGGTP